MISNGELPDPLCDGVNRDLTLVRLYKHVVCCNVFVWISPCIMVMTTQ